MKPICASSPAARIVVVTSSVPVGAPSGFGGGVVACAARRARARRGSPRAGRGASRARRRARLRLARLRRAFGFGRRGLRRLAARATPWLRRFARAADAFRAARGERSEHAGCAWPCRASGLVRHRRSSVRLERCSSPAIMAVTTSTHARAALRSAGYRTGPKLRVEVDNRSA